MSKFDELYCAHVEQIGMRYPDAYHIRYAWTTDKDQVESKVILVDDGIEIFVSFLAADGTIQHFTRLYTPYLQRKKPVGAGFRTN
jgi:hypothetical protein